MAEPVCVIVCEGLSVVEEVNEGVAGALGEMEAVTVAVRVCVSVGVCVPVKEAVRVNVCVPLPV